MSLHDLSLSDLPHTAARSVKKMNSLGLETYADLLTYYPFRYENFVHHVSIKELKNIMLTHIFEEASSEQTSIVDMQEGFTIRGVVKSFSNFRTRRGMYIQKVHVTDSTDMLELTFFNQKYLSAIMREGRHIAVSGFIRDVKGVPTFQQQEFDILEGPDDTGIHTGRIIPVYSTIRGISTKTIREKIQYVIGLYGQTIEEILPDEIIKNHDITKRAQAIQNIHFPDSIESLMKARERLAFDELFIIQLTSHMIKEEWNKEEVSHKLDMGSHNADIQDFIDSLPFTLTDAQARSYKEILQDMEGDSPMNRLLQGDVGSGKTIVAATAAYGTKLNGCKALFMAPTEILAQQHYESLTKTFTTLATGIKPHIVLKTSKHSPSTDEIAEADLIVGTHALISKKATFKDVALVIIDEQHKFGVAQRAQLTEKGQYPHILSMTATPIPRTVMLTMYGELDISTIDEMPAGRKDIKTHVVPDRKRTDAYEWIRNEISQNKAQVFIVCPFIEESSVETMKNVKAAKAEFERLSTQEFKDFSVGLLHGKQKSQEKNDMMENFSTGKLNILVSTPVVEVGIDVPQATIIVVETAERFGLAQLHQLRGRVGRSDKQSYCLLFADSDQSIGRLKKFASTNNGFELAEYDLQRRGAGNIFGTQQHGSTQLAIASLLDAPLVHDTQNAVKTFTSAHDLENFEELKHMVDDYHVKHVAPN